MPYIYDKFELVTYFCCLSVTGCITSILVTHLLQLALEINHITVCIVIFDLIQKENIYLDLSILRRLILEVGDQSKTNDSCLRVAIEASMIGCKRGLYPIQNMFDSHNGGNIILWSELTNKEMFFILSGHFLLLKINCYNDQLASLDLSITLTYRPNHVQPAIYSQDSNIRSLDEARTALMSLLTDNFCLQTMYVKENVYCLNILSESFIKSIPSLTLLEKRMSGSNTSQVYIQTEDDSSFYSLTSNCCNIVQPTPADVGNTISLLAAPIATSAGVFLSSQEPCFRAAEIPFTDASIISSAQNLTQDQHLSNESLNTKQVVPNKSLSAKQVVPNESSSAKSTPKIKCPITHAIKNTIYCLATALPVASSMIQSRTTGVAVPSVKTCAPVQPVTIGVMVQPVKTSVKVQPVKTNPAVLSVRASFPVQTVRTDVAVQPVKTSAIVQSRTTGLAVQPISTDRASQSIITDIACDSKSIVSCINLATDVLNNVGQMTFSKSNNPVAAYTSETLSSKQRAINAPIAKSIPSLLDSLPPMLVVSISSSLTPTILANLTTASSVSSTLVNSGVFNRISPITESNPTLTNNVFVNLSVMKTSAVNSSLKKISVHSATTKTVSGSSSSIKNTPASPASVNTASANLEAVNYVSLNSLPAKTSIRPPSLTTALTYPASVKCVSLNPTTMKSITISPSSVHAVSVSPLFVSTVSVSPSPVLALSVSSSSVRAVSVNPSPVRAESVSSSPVRAVSVRPSPVRAVSVSLSPVRAVSVSPSPVRAVSVSSSPVRAVSVSPSPVRAVSVSSSSIQAVSVSPSPVRAASVSQSSVRAVSVSPSPVRAASVSQSSVRTVSVSPSPVRAVSISSSPVRAVSVNPSPVRAVSISPMSVRAVSVSPMPVRAVSVSSSPVRAVSVSPSPVRAVSVSPSPVRAVSVSSSPVPDDLISLLSVRTVSVTPSSTCTTSNQKVVAKQTTRQVTIISPAAKQAIYGGQAINNTNQSLTSCVTNSVKHASSSVSELKSVCSHIQQGLSVVSKPEIVTPITSVLIIPSLQETAVKSTLQLNKQSVLGSTNNTNQSHCSTPSRTVPAASNDTVLERKNAYKKSGEHNNMLISNSSSTHSDSSIVLAPVILSISSSDPRSLSKNSCSHTTNLISAKNEMKQIKIDSGLEFKEAQSIKSIESVFNNSSAEQIRVANKLVQIQQSLPCSSEVSMEGNKFYADTSLSTISSITTATSVVSSSFSYAMVSNAMLADSFTSTFSKTEQITPFLLTNSTVRAINPINSSLPNTHLIPRRKFSEESTSTKIASYGNIETRTDACVNDADRTDSNYVVADEQAETYNNIEEIMWVS